MEQATCNFCGQRFRNRQAVRAHLKGCAAYRQKPKATLPSLGSKPRTAGLGDRHPGTRPTRTPSLRKTALAANRLEWPTTLTTSHTGRSCAG